MKLPKSILRGYDRVTEKTMAKVLGIELPKRSKVYRKFKLKQLKAAKR